MGNRIDELQGQIKQGLGSITGNEEMEREGAAQTDEARMKREAEGAVDQAAGTVEEKAGEVTDDPETELRGKARQTEGDIERTG